jgi:hypothetical protein
MRRTGRGSMHKTLYVSSEQTSHEYGVLILAYDTKNEPSAQQRTPQQVLFQPRTSLVRYFVEPALPQSHKRNRSKCLTAQWADAVWYKELQPWRSDAGAVWYKELQPWRSDAGSRDGGASAPPCSRAPIIRIAASDARPPAPPARPAWPILLPSARARAPSPRACGSAPLERTRQRLAPARAEPLARIGTAGPVATSLGPAPALPVPPSARPACTPSIPCEPAGAGPRPARKPVPTAVRADPESGPGRPRSRPEADPESGPGRSRIRPGRSRTGPGRYRAGPVRY